MTTRILWTILVLMLTVTGCKVDPVHDSRVYQGTCITLEDGGKTLKLANSQPNLNPIKGESATFDVSTAKVGASPQPGDVIRVSFLEQGGKMVALKVMNVTRQDLSKQ
jgi:hypothetical protein